MNYTELKPYALAELLKLRSLLTDAEKERVQSFHTYYISAENPKECIYGRITGDCFNDRATELIIKCSDKFINFEHKTGNFIDNINKRFVDDKERTFSPVEVWITDRYLKDYSMIGNDSRITRVIKVLQGKSNKL